MKNLITILLVFMCSLLNSDIQAQYNSYYGPCEMVQNPPPLNPSTTGGQYKPESIDKYTDLPTAFFPVLIVFVQFSDESTINPNGHGTNWLPGQTPVYMSQLIATQKATGYGNNWWDAYDQNTEYLSDAWMEMSRGHFHLVGQSVSVIHDNPSYYYQFSNGGHGIKQINDDIYEKLKQIPTLDWRYFDKWRKNLNTNTFEYDKDGYVDMIYKYHRTYINDARMIGGGIAMLDSSYQYGANYPIYIQGNDTIWINGDFGEIGSGVTMICPTEMWGVASFTEHEFGHYLFGSGHGAYGKMSGAGADFGVDECLSPWESIKLGYMLPYIVNFSNPEYYLGDYSSRNITDYGEVLQVDVAPAEFFLIANRRQRSYYDKIMWGDTCRGNPHYDLGDKDYGKGIYIYHSPNNYYWPPYMDQECADGLWDYTQDRYDTPDWSESQQIPVFEKREPVFSSNDQSEYYIGSTTGLFSKDAKSVNKAFWDPVGQFYYWHFSWFGIGKRHTCVDMSQECSKGIDRVFTNRKDTWTSREWQGDRWDPWNIHYNEVFSPYSSPSTAKWYDNSNTGIFIYYDTLMNDSAHFKIYKAGQGGYSESQILQLTPPAKPMNLQVGVVNFPCDSPVVHPILTWHHNIEPDMFRSGNPDFKRYKIFRATSMDTTLIPDIYIYIGSADIPVNSSPSYTDYGVDILCSSTPDPDWKLYTRYKVSAVDITDWESVKSDFASIKAHRLHKDNLVFENNIPTRFDLAQNYPNPFNPTTEIKYSMPINAFVTIKVYNLLGEEVSRLVNNEFKTIGYYSTQFNGTNFASGMYFYRIEAGNYISTKKMILVK